MSNETPKQKAVREAWYIQYKIPFAQIEQWIDENGWMGHGRFLSLMGCIDPDYDTFNKHTFKVQPNTLDGIDTNNSWLTVEEHGFPQEFEEVFICTVSDGQKDGVFTYSEFYGGFRKGAITWPSFRVTHYQPVVKPKPPIY